MADLQIDGKDVTVDGRGQFHITENGQDVSATSFAALKVKLKKLAATDTQFPFEGYTFDGYQRTSAPDPVTVKGIEKTRSRSWRNHKFLIQPPSNRHSSEATIIYEFTPEQVAEMSVLAKTLANAKATVDALSRETAAKMQAICKATPRYTLDEHANIVKVTP